MGEDDKDGGLVRNTEGTLWFEDIKERPKLTEFLYIFFGIHTETSPSMSGEKLPKLFQQSNVYNGTKHLLSECGAPVETENEKIRPKTEPMI